MFLFQRAHKYRWSIHVSLYCTWKYSPKAFESDMLPLHLRQIDDQSYQMPWWSCFFWPRLLDSSVRLPTLGMQLSTKICKFVTLCIVQGKSNFGSKETQVKLVILIMIQIREQDCRRNTVTCTVYCFIWTPLYFFSLPFSHFSPHPLNPKP